MYKHKLTSKEKRWIVYFLIVVALCFVTLFSYKCITTKVCKPMFLENIVRSNAEISFPAGKIIALVADTTESREEGLSGRSGLKDGEGMLFDFGMPGKFGFWMKDMLFPIDMIWINSDGVIVNIVENALPEDYPATYINTPPATYVLEIGANKSREYGLFLGSKLKIIK